MSAFAEELDLRIDELRSQLAAARAEENDHLVETLLDELQNLVDLAESNDVDTGQMNQVLAFETGAIPVVAESES